jgi:hypothetical protein
VSKPRKQPPALARAREERERAQLEVRKVAALERIAAALEAANERRLPRVVVRPSESSPAYDVRRPLSACCVQGCEAAATDDEHGFLTGWCAAHFAERRVQR